MVPATTGCTSPGSSTSVGGAAVHLMGNFVTAPACRELYRRPFTFVGHLHGGLAMATVLACAGSGAIWSLDRHLRPPDQMAHPSMREHGYSDELAAGSIAAGGIAGHPDFRRRPSWSSTADDRDQHRQAVRRRCRAGRRRHPALCPAVRWHHFGADLTGRPAWPSAPIRRANGSPPRCVTSGPWPRFRDRDGRHLRWCSPPPASTPRRLLFRAGAPRSPRR